MKIGKGSHWKLQIDRDGVEDTDCSLRKNILQLIATKIIRGCATGTEHYGEHTYDWKLCHHTVTRGIVEPAEGITDKAAEYVAYDVIDGKTDGYVSVEFFRK